MKTRLPVLLVALTLLLPLACKGDKTRTPPTIPPPSPSAPATRPVSSPSASATAGPTQPPIDGTVDPLGAGDVTPVTVKSNPDPASGISVLTDVRVGAHPEQGGWDRIVFEFRDTQPAAQIAYATAPVAQCASGQPVTVDGAAVLTVRLESTQAHNDAGQLTIKSTSLAGPGNAIVEAKQTCDFEGVDAWAIGVKGQQRFKVTRLASPTRIVIDIKW